MFNLMKYILEQRNKTMHDAKFNDAYPPPNLKIE